MNDVTITIDFQLNEADTYAAQCQIAVALDELIGEAIAGGAFELGRDAEVLSYQVIVDD